MNEKLKRCPFCGSKVTIMSTLRLPIKLFKCDNWYSCGAVVSFDNQETAKDQKKAIKYFNKRVKND